MTEGQKHQARRGGAMRRSREEEGSDEGAPSQVWGSGGYALEVYEILQCIFSFWCILAWLGGAKRYFDRSFRPSLGVDASAFMLRLHLSPNIIGINSKSIGFSTTASAKQFEGGWFYTSTIDTGNGKVAAKMRK